MVTVATGGIWTTNGTGVVGPTSTTLNGTYYQSSADTASRSVTFTLTSTGNGVCGAVSDQMVINISPTPIINAGADQTLCADAEAVQLGGFEVNAIGTVWTTNGSGSFSPDANNINALYYPSSA